MPGTSDSKDVIPEHWSDKFHHIGYFPEQNRILIKFMFVFKRTYAFRFTISDDHCFETFTDF